MGDPSKFTNVVQYNLFNTVFIAILLSEAVIFIKTYQKKGDSKRRDNGTKWLLIGCYAVCIYMSVLGVSQRMPEQIRLCVLPYFVSWLGIAMVGAGVSIRLTAVFTLKKAFTVNVQTTNSQHLITNGIYHLVRNPSYTGSILSLVGVAVSFRNIVSIILVVMISMVCYMTRIHTEEIALSERFGDEFADYAKNTWRLFPYIF